MPMLPVQLYKHNQQIRYNQGKPGLDKNTEVSLRVSFTSNLTFESKYILSIIDRILVNAWRAETSITVIKPWLISLRKKRKEA